MAVAKATKTASKQSSKKTSKVVAAVRDLDDGTYFIHAKSSGKGHPKNVENALDNLRHTMTELRRDAAARRKSA